MSKLLSVAYDDVIENSVVKIIENLKGKYILSKRTIALLLLQEDEDIIESVRGEEGSNFIRINQIIDETKNKYDKPLNYIISLTRQKKLILWLVK